MPLRIRRLSLNDLPQIEAPDGSIVPSSQEICDDVVLLWREEPSTETLNLSELLNRLRTRHSEWKLDRHLLKLSLIRHNLHIEEMTSKTNIYGPEIVFPKLEERDFYKLSNIKRLMGSVKLSSDPNDDNRNRRLLANKAFQPGDIIYEEPSPLCIIPPMDKLTLMESGKLCSLCAKNLSGSKITTHFIMTNSLDCSDCNAVWCCKTCKKKHYAVHSALKHNKHKSQAEIRTKNWNAFETFCKKNVSIAMYSTALIYANIVINRDKKLQDELSKLANVSQKVRLRLSDSMNIGGTFDQTSGAMGPKNPEGFWEEAHKLFCDLFPDLEKITGDHFSEDTFLKEIGKFNINQISNQLYFVSSFLNHNCEPNTYYEIGPKLELKLYARKPIEEGEELFIAYVNPLHDTRLRRRELRVNYGFQCNCKRCQRGIQQALKTSPPHASPRNVYSEKSARRRNSSMRDQRPDLSELLKSGQEFDLEVPTDPTVGRSGRRRTSVRFDGNVFVAVEEE